MTDNLFKLLNEHFLRGCAGRQIYNRGESYYRMGQVEIQSVNSDESRCRVRGTRYYQVELLSQKSSGSNYYNYYYHYDYPLVEYLSLLSQVEIPLFQGNAHNPVKRYLRLLSEPGEIALRIERPDEGVRLSLDLIAEGQTLDLVNDPVQILTKSEPYWLLAGNRVVEFQSPFSLDRLTSWLRNPGITIFTLTPGRIPLWKCRLPTACTVSVRTSRFSFTNSSAVIPLRRKSYNCRTERKPSSSSWSAPRVVSSRA